MASPKETQTGRFNYLDTHINQLVQRTGAIDPVAAALDSNGTQAPLAGYALEARIIGGRTAHITCYAYNQGMLRLGDAEGSYADGGTAHTQTRSVWMSLAPGHSKTSFTFNPDQGFALLTPYPQVGPASAPWGTRLLQGESPTAGGSTHCMALLAPDSETAQNVMGCWGDALELTEDQTRHFKLQTDLYLGMLNPGDPLPPEPRPTLGAAVVNFFRN